MKIPQNNVPQYLIDDLHDCEVRSSLALMEVEGMLSCPRKNKKRFNELSLLCRQLMYEKIGINAMIKKAKLRK